MTTTTDKVANYRDIFKHALNGIQRDLRDSELSEEDRIDLALILWKIRDRSETLLDPVKAKFRAKAKERLGVDENQVRFEGNDGTCLVVFPETHLRLRKDVNVEELKAMLGNNFAQFFETRERHIPRREALNENLSRIASPSDRSLVLSALEQHDPTPRVNFSEKDPWEK